MVTRRKRAEKEHQESAENNEAVPAPGSSQLANGQKRDEKKRSARSKKQPTKASSVGRNRNTPGQSQARQQQTIAPPTSGIMNAAHQNQSHQQQPAAPSASSSSNVPHQSQVQQLPLGMTGTRWFAPGLDTTSNENHYRAISGILAPRQKLSVTDAILHVEAHWRRLPPWMRDFHMPIDPADPSIGKFRMYSRVWVQLVLNYDDTQDRANHWIQTGQYETPRGPIIDLSPPPGINKPPRARAAGKKTGKETGKGGTGKKRKRDDVEQEREEAEPGQPESSEDNGEAQGDVEETEAQQPQSSKDNGDETEDDGAGQPEHSEINDGEAAAILLSLVHAQAPESAERFHITSGLRERELATSRSTLHKTTARQQPMSLRPKPSPINPKNLAVNDPSAPDELMQLPSAGPPKTNYGTTYAASMGPYPEVLRGYFNKRGLWASERYKVSSVSGKKRRFSIDGDEMKGFGVVAESSTRSGRRIRAK
ncbi:hypothetical protein BDV96DRAFT_572394 [Lophiotrema nucula]|uniref:Uncharacterized protein n=1 Tax=Lophiotrema nucula TaxID=690887 RepID=A0A6A5ZCT8_9PLEO|nr:hypothetical protein BDV96DRAFT_572394 [Lophiotrema nucula]